MVKITNDQKYLLVPVTLGFNYTKKIFLTEKEYMQAKEADKKIFTLLEIELAFDFLVMNYIDIEKYIAEGLVTVMTAENIYPIENLRTLHYGFIRKLNNWLSSLSFWYDFTKSHHQTTYAKKSKKFKELENKFIELKENLFETAFFFHLRNYALHKGFPVTGHTSRTKWMNIQGTDNKQVVFQADYILYYDDIRSFFENSTSKGSRERKRFGKQVEEKYEDQKIDVKKLLRLAMITLEKAMKDIRSLTQAEAEKHTGFIERLFNKFNENYPNSSENYDLAIILDEASITNFEESYVRSKE